MGVFSYSAKRNGRNSSGKNGAVGFNSILSRIPSEKKNT
jgi:hypothetical protein